MHHLSLALTPELFVTPQSKPGVGELVFPVPWAVPLSLVREGSVGEASEILWGWGRNPDIAFGGLSPWSEPGLFLILGHGLARRGGTLLCGSPGTPTPPAGRTVG